MNEDLKNSLNELLKEKAQDLVHSKDMIGIQLHKMNDLDNMMKIIRYYDELEPVLHKFFKEKAEEEKWSEER